MLKFTILFALLFTALTAFASPMDHMMTMKERVRLSLWMEGLGPQKAKLKPLPKRQIVLPPELEISLQNL